jgi:hypothetical protein
MSEPSYESIPLEQFQQVFKDTSTGELQLLLSLVEPLSEIAHVRIISLEVSSVALGGKIVSFSDEFFAEASNLLKVHVSSGFLFRSVSVH